MTTEPFARRIPDPDEPQLSPADIAAGERYAEPHDPGPAEQYAGAPVPDPWEEASDGELEPGAVPGDPQE
ncbi:hypothetical protein GCM10020358_66950 [Amorphoplanes nipponensis]|uniref:Uncharacterized protein n=1 Tax=Actinoplanes nipponensis TaxID=135950 RepID=A0A919MLC7_9ACTN|nr:hypothetical protein [Actinoplanes nipponensis]GIE53809.1 hypothetical protein Ani05nite_73430 [Actinoplanes nipponensis]